jgi:hypothetical protein
MLQNSHICCAILSVTGNLLRYSRDLTGLRDALAIESLGPGGIEQGSDANKTYQIINISLEENQLVQFQNLEK